MHERLTLSFLSELAAPAANLPGGIHTNNNSSSGSSSSGGASGGSSSVSGGANSGGGGVGGVGTSSASGTNNNNTASHLAVSGPSTAGVTVPGPTGPLMNNGSRDMSSADLQKLQQQLHDIKEQVSRHLYFMNLHFN